MVKIKRNNEDDQGDEDFDRNGSDLQWWYKIPVMTVKKVTSGQGTDVKKRMFGNNLKNL